MQHRHELRRVDHQLVHEQGAQLRIAVLLDDEYLLVSRDEIRDASRETERRGRVAYPRWMPCAASFESVSSIAGPVDP